MKPWKSGTKPFAGSSSPTGGSKRKLTPSRVKVSVIGLKRRSPENARAVTISGEPMNERVSVFPSLRAGKLRLNELTMLFFSPLTMSSRFHWPMQGPQALASTVAPAEVSASS